MQRMEEGVKIGVCGSGSGFVRSPKSSHPEASDSLKQRASPSVQRKGLDLSVGETQNIIKPWCGRRR